MSRRKQSHPKPLKLEESVSAGDGSGHNNGDRTLDHRDHDSLSQSPSDGSKSGESPRHSPSRTSPSPDPPASLPRDRGDSSDSSRPPKGSESGSPTGSPDPGGQKMLVSLVSQLQLPSEVLFLRRREGMGGKVDAPLAWAVCSSIPLPHGSSLGPFQGEIIARHDIKVGHLIIQFVSKSGVEVLVNVANQSGAWLTLLQSAHQTRPTNTKVHFQGGTIWCNVEADLEVGSELVASFTFHSDRESPPSPMADSLPPSPLPAPASPLPQPPTLSPTPRARPREADVIKRETPTVVNAGKTHAALIYGCPFCGVRFSSARTLQAHITFYCSKKPPEPLPPALPPQEADREAPAPTSTSPTSTTSTPTASTTTPLSTSKQTAIKADVEVKVEPAEVEDASTEEELSSSRSPGKRGAEEAGSETEGGLPAAKSSKSGQVYRCSDCSYTADKLSSLNRHRRIHNRPAAEGRGVGVHVPPSETYCQECNIQFSSLSTFRGHKEYYCALRNRDRHSSEGEGAPDPKRPKLEGDALPPGALSPLTPGAVGGLPVSVGAAYPPGTVLVPAGSVMSGLVTPSMAAAMPGTPTVVIATPLVTPEGLSSVALTMPTVVVQSLVKVTSSPPVSTSLTSGSPMAAHSGSSPPKPPPPGLMQRGELPLDLSTRRGDSKPRGEAKPPQHGVEREKEKDAEEESEGREREKSKQSEGAEGGKLTLKIEPPSSSTERKTPPTQSPAAGLLPAQPLPPGMSVPGHGLLAGMVPTLLPFAPLGGLGGAGGMCAMPPNVSKCADCNIVFYKHENYIVHKQHYCSGKKLPTPIAPAPAPPPAAAAPSPATSDSAAELSARTMTSPASDAGETKVKTERQSPAAPTPNDKWPAPGAEASGAGQRVFYRFFCVPCKIKFSSASTLQAHKEYYCPHGKDSEQTVLVQSPRGEVMDPSGAATSPKEDSPGGARTPGAEFRCDQCGNHFMTARLLRLHLCPASESAQSLLLHCSHCEYVTQTENRLNEHMKVHAPNKAYRCTVCGYRGNTVRGMRMHGKMHLDHGEEFTDGNILEYEEPPLVPIQPSNGPPHNGGSAGLTLAQQVASDAELLIRLKNEPYKRRRSRKSYEKSENSRHMDAPVQCPVPGCGEVLPSYKFLPSHMHLHELAACQQLELQQQQQQLQQQEQENRKEERRVKEETRRGEPEPDQDQQQRRRDDRKSEGRGAETESPPKSKDSPQGNDAEEEQRRRDATDEDAAQGRRHHPRQKQPQPLHPKQEQLEDAESKCSLCAFSSARREEMDRHLEAHRAERESSSSSSPPIVRQARAASSRSSDTPSPPKTASPASRVALTVKEEKEDSGYDRALENRHPLPDSDPDSPPRAGCKSVSSELSRTSKDASSNGRSPGDELRRSPVNHHHHHHPGEPSTVRVKKEPADAAERGRESPGRESPSPKSLPRIPSPIAKHSSEETPSARPLPSPTPSKPSIMAEVSSRILGRPTPHVLPYFLYPHPGMVPAPTPAGLGPRTPPPDRSSSRYCQNCDITFTYQSSYAAHKKYYCSALRAGEQASPTATG